MSSNYNIDILRSARVHIVYDVEVGDAIQMMELPFVVGVLAELSGNANPRSLSLKDSRRKFIEIDRDNFDDMMRRIRPRLKYEVNDTFTNDDTKLFVELNFQCMADFSPEDIARQVPPLQECLDARIRLIGLRSTISPKGQGLLKTVLDDEATLAWLRVERDRGTLATCTLLEKLVEEGRMGLSGDEKELARQWVGEFFQQVLTDRQQVEKDNNIMVMIDRYVACFDEKLSRQLNEIMHNHAFQALEAAWLGLHYFVTQTATSALLKVRVLDVSKDELWKDVTKAAEFDQSSFYKKVYEEEYGIFGSAPYGLLIGCYEFSKSRNDVDLLKALSNIAAAAHAPFLAAASPNLLGLDTFTDLPLPRDLAKIFDTVEYRKWHAFRSSDSSRYVGLTLPRILLRLPYLPSTTAGEGLNFMEEVDGRDDSKYLWGNGAFAIAARVTDAFAKYGWTAAIRGVESGGRVDGLPLHVYPGDDGAIVLKCPTEVSISDRREKELSDLGFLPLVHCKGTDYAVFFSAQSCQKVKRYDTDVANVNSRLTTQLPYIMAASRFAHYLKVIMRDKIGSFMIRRECEQFLNRWIANYVGEEGGVEVRAKFPLREARIDLTEVPGKMGLYRAVAFLRPHFQLEELTVSLRVVVELPAQAR